MKYAGKAFLSFVILAEVWKYHFGFVKVVFLVEIYSMGCWKILLSIIKGN